VWRDGEAPERDHVTWVVRVVGLLEVEASADATNLDKLVKALGRAYPDRWVDAAKLGVEGPERFVRRLEPRSVAQESEQEGLF
jgi:hypothetical protein